MPLNPSGQISLGGNVEGQSVNLELQRSATAMINLNDTDLRSLFGIVSGQISLSNGWGKSAGATDGYFEGTQTASPTQGGQVSRYTFATNTASAPGVRLSPSAPKATGYAGVNTPARAYFARGNSGTPNFAGAVAYDGGSQIDGIVFSSQTYFDSAAELVQPRFSLCLNANSTTRGYFGGGSISPWPIQYPQIDGITFATDSQYDVAAGVGGNDTTVNKQHVQSATRGYFAGAVSSPSRSQPAAINRLTFDTETYSALGATLVQARWLSGGLHSPTRGYFLGGAYPPSAPAPTTQIDGITFDTETQYDAAASMTAGYANPVSMIQGSYGIHSNATTTGITQSDKFTFSTETIQDIGAAAGGIAYAGTTGRFSGTQNSSF